MQELFENISGDLIEDERIRAAVERLWTEVDRHTVRAVVDSLLASGDVVASAAVFDRYSYSRTTWGSWLASAFDGLSDRLLIRARQILAAAWGGEPGIRAETREPVIAGAMHMIWRGVEIADAPLVLRALRDEPDARIVFPAVAAAQLIAPLDPEFTAAAMPLLVSAVARRDLPPVTRRTAVSVVGRSALPEAIDRLAEVLGHLPADEAAGLAMELLDADPSHRRVVDQVAAKWSDPSGRDAQLVLRRLNGTEREE